MRKFILDCDPGLDDALAILLATRLKNLELLAVTVVNGNTGLEKATINASSILKILNKDNIKVYAGEADTIGVLKRDETSIIIHGHDGIGDIGIPIDTSLIEKEDAVTYMYNTLKNSPEKITIIATGPLTNIAKLLKDHPDIKDQIAKLIIMGGAVNHRGNITAYAEMNIFSDPEAAQIVLDSQIVPILVPLDVTLEALVTEEMLEIYEQLTDPKINIMTKLLRRYGNGYLELYHSWSCPMHDGLCVLYADDESLLELEDMYLNVIDSSKEERGMTVQDPEKEEQKIYNVQVAQRLDQTKFKDLFNQILVGDNHD